MFNFGNRKSVTAFALAAFLSIAAAPAESKTLTIGIDLSGSNPLLVHENFAQGAAQYVRKEIEKLSAGDQVQILTFGARENARNLINSRVEISRKMRPQKVAETVGKFILSLPNNANNAQSSTNLLAWLEFTSGFDCAGDGSIVVLTDGIEASALVDGMKFIEGKTKLPKAEVDLKGCALTFYGLGAGLSPVSVKHIRSAWAEWSGQAGARFEAIIP